MTSAPYELEIDNDKLKGFVSSFAKVYQGNEPFPHIVIDDFANPRVLEKILAEFPDESHPSWKSMYDQNQKKFAANQTEILGPVTRNFLNYLNGREVVNFLSDLTGISGLIPDPHLAGGGLHEIRRGGMLRVHADFNWHELMRLDRRINLIIYLNKDWKPEYGGQLELYDPKMNKCYKKIDPLFNRCVIFNTTDFSFHGHPDPLNCPPERRRRSMAMYYYSNGRPKEELSPQHQTLFRQRAGEASAGEAFSDFMKKFVPPIAWDALKQIRKRPSEPRG